MPVDTSISKPRLLGLDALRGILALAVVARHTSLLTDWDIVPSGFLAVDVFFMMSGYVIAHAYESKLLRGNYVREYTLRRYLRLAPMWLVGLTIGTLARLVLVHKESQAVLSTSGAFVLAIFFIPFPSGNWLFGSNPPGWSLFFEVAANLAYGWLVKIYRGIGLIIVILSAGSTVFFCSWLNGGMDGGANWTNFYVGAARTVYGFSLGIFLFQKRRIFTGRDWSPVVFVIVTSLFCGSLLARPTGAPAFIVDAVVVIFLCPLLVFCALNCRVKTERLAEALGAISYPLYAIHFSIFAAAVGFRYSVLKLHGPMSVAAAIPLVLVVIAIAYVLGAFVDPMIQGRLATMRQRRPVGVPSSQ